MYGEEYYENSMRNSQNDDIMGTSSRIIGMDTLENDLRPKGKNKIKCYTQVDQLCHYFTML